MKPDRPSIDSSNWFFVSAAAGDRIVINGTVPPVLTRDQAVNLAAWLVAVADPAGEHFAAVLAAVRKA